VASASAAGPDAVSRLSWALRRYAGVVVGATVLTALLVQLIAPPAEPEEYHAPALVVAQQLEGVRAEHLPRMAEAIFSGNNVAQETVRRTGLPIRSDELVPDYAWVEVVEGTVVMRVLGAAEDPRLASAIATTAAETLVDELNRLGPGVGVFALQEPAPVPEDPAPRPRRIPPALLGLVGGVILGVGLAFLLLVLRRPVIEVDEALALIDEPLVGVLELSRGGHYDPIEDVSGGIALVDELYPRRREVQVLVAANEEATRSQVSMALTRILATLGPVFVVTARDRAGQRAARVLQGMDNVRLLEDPGESSPAYQPTQSVRPIPVVADGHPSVRLMLPSSVRPVLVVREGISAQELRQAVRHLQPQQARGIIWVASRGGVGLGFLRRFLSGRHGGQPEVRERPESVDGGDEAAAPREPSDAAGREGDDATRRTLALLDENGARDGSPAPNGEVGQPTDEGAHTAESSRASSSTEAGTTHR
jgi:hypothetical protein